MVYKNTSGIEVDSVRELNLENIILNRIFSKIMGKGPGISLKFDWPEDHIAIISSDTLEQLKEDGDCELLKGLEEQEKTLFKHKTTLDGLEVTLTITGKLNSNELVLRGGSNVLIPPEET